MKFVNHSSGDTKLNFYLLRLLNSSIGKNIFSLYFLQFIEYLLPFITVPYLVRVLGSEWYGTIAFCQGLVSYFTIFVEYGFNLSATRKISENRDKKHIVNYIAVNILSGKMLLFITGFVVILVLTSLIKKLNELQVMLIVIYLFLLGKVFFPVWLFQGMEKMVLMSMIHILVSFIMVGSIFIFVKRSEHYMIYLWVLSTSAILEGLLAVIIGFYKFDLRILLPSFKGIIEVFREGWMVFLSTASSSLYTAGNAFILGLLAPASSVGYFAAGEKIVKATLPIFAPINRAIYPRMSKLVSESQELALKLARKVLKFNIFVGFNISLFLFIFAPLITHILLGKQFVFSISVIRILSLLPLMVGISNVLGVQILLPFKKDRIFTLTLFFAGLVNIISALIFVPLLKEKGMALAVMLSEMFVTFSMCVIVIILNLNPFRKFSYIQI